MKILGVFMVVLALVIGIVPMFTDCESQGRALTLENGRTISMKCHWTARAELAIATPLLAVGGLLAFRKRTEGTGSLALVGAVLGAAVVALPNWLVGVCANPDMLCNMIMKPALTLSGILVMGASLAVWWQTRAAVRPVEQGQPA